MKAALRKAWESRSPRERSVLAVLAAFVVVLAYGLLVYAAERDRTALRARVASLRTQAVLLDQQAAEYGRLSASVPPTASPGELRALVQARTDASRMAGALTRLDAVAAGQVQATFGAVAFADWLAWAAALDAQQVRVESARIEALAAPGMVSVTATLTRARGN